MLLLPVEMLVGTEDDDDLAVSVLLIVDTESLALDIELPDESIERFSVRLGKPETSGGTMFTTLIPWPVIPEAGMNRVVVPT